MLLGRSNQEGCSGGCVFRDLDRRYTCKILVEKLKDSNCFEELGADVRIILNLS
jgi:hypothetical protein